MNPDFAIARKCANPFIEPKFDYADDFKSGIAEVYLNCKGEICDIGYIDKIGKYV
jgi:hypothetical protein